VRRLLAALALGAVLAGCGDGDDSASLVERLPGDARALSAIDLAAVKERLGLPDDADPTRAPGDAGGEAQARLFAYTGGAFPYVVRFDRVLMEAIDESRVTQAATTPVSGPDTVVVLATDQPFDDEIASRLERAGYRPDGGLLVMKRPGDRVASRPWAARMAWWCWRAMRRPHGARSRGTRPTGRRAIC
jgi:hypothetical protein